MKNTLYFLLLLLNVSACQKDKTTTSNHTTVAKPQQIVVISKHAPDKYRHYLTHDSIGMVSDSLSGPFSPVKRATFSYFDSQNRLKDWQPKIDAIDTLVISYHRDYLELSIRNPFAAQTNTYLIKNGDTLIFEYNNRIPIAKITNREVSDIELNYSNHRIKTLFDNKYTSHHKVFLGFLLSDLGSVEDRTIGFYEDAIEDAQRESLHLDSLFAKKTLSEASYNYRKAALNWLVESHKNNKVVKTWTDQNEALLHNEDLKREYSIDLSETDSLMTFSFFRGYLNYISKYDLKFIQEDNGSSGAFYIDSRIRFDSILNDKQFNQTAKNFLLHNTYQEIGRNFKVKDKAKYFKKLQEHTTDIEKLNTLQKTYNLDFSKSDQLVLTNIKNDTLTFSKLLAQHKGQWLYVDFWASWCKPCRNLMPDALKLKEALKDKNIAFLYLSLNDNKDVWKKAMEVGGIISTQSYFIENGNTSKVIEDLGINSIPHYLIYSPNGELVNGYAKRPGKGAKAQLLALMQNQ